jgi:hypothetical protein
MEGNRSNRHQLLKGNNLYSDLYGVYIEVLHDLTAVLKENAAKRETAKTTITAPPSIEQFHEKRKRKRKHNEDADKRAKKPTISTTEVNDFKLHSKSQVPTRKLFASLRSTEMETDHRDDAGDTTDRQQYQATSSQAVRQPPIVLTSQVNLIQL